MNNLKNEPMVSNQVHTTTDYARFVILAGNRKPNDIHVKRLSNSFKKNYLFSPILINEKWQIIDGQHRFLAAKELGLPIYYIIVPGYGLNEVQILNTNSSNWKKEDYLKAYCDLGVENYLKMNQFMQEFVLEDEEMHDKNDLIDFSKYLKKVKSLELNYHLILQKVFF
jgi:hypothetical protein